MIFEEQVVAYFVICDALVTHLMLVSYCVVLFEETVVAGFVVVMHK